MSLFNSKLWENIEETGELPPVRVGVEVQSLVNLGITLVIVFIIIILTLKITKRL